MTTEHAILIVLRPLQGLMLPQDTLHIEVNLTVPRAVTALELGECLQRMEKLRWIVGVFDALTQKTLWKITTQGQAILAEHSTLGGAQ